MSLEILRDRIERPWNAASKDWRPAELASLYAEDAVFHGGRAAHATGRADIEAYFRSYSDVFQGMSLSFVDQEIRVISPSAFLAQGFGDFRFEFRDGSRSANRLRTTLVVTEAGGEWRVLLQHFSPIPDAPPLGT